MRIYWWLILISMAFSNFIIAQENLIYVDDDGRMRWTQNNNEAYFWGVNYSTPFAFSYRAVKRLGLNHEDVIDHDVMHFKRMGLNAYRIHVWDREVSDRQGNLIENEHIRLLDYLIAKLIENNIYIILTPIAWWGNGYPEPDTNTEGFSDFGSKLELTTKPEFIIAEKNYIKQFVNHRNPYTGKTYNEEPNIILFEIYNEPKLPPDSNAVTEYVNTLVDELRKTDVTKPIFFNISENPQKQQWNGVANSNIQGISFQWYPTGLVSRHTLKGNYLPHVSRYPLPDYSNNIANKAKMVYEFDAPDIAASTMYPAMAESFKDAGMQWATMFSYDPTPIAAFNAEYITHFLNLAYTPAKAIGFTIAGKLFLSDNNDLRLTKANFKVDSNNDLSLLNSEEYFYYTGSNSEEPAAPSKIIKITGVGSSKLIEYNGTGAYFLDKIEKGRWALDVFPDAVWFKDPFGNNNLVDPVAELIWSRRQMKILLPALKNDFFLYSNVEDPELLQRAENNNISISPGSYIISNELLEKEKLILPEAFDFNDLKKLTWKQSDETRIVNITPSQITEGDSSKIKFCIYHIQDSASVNVYIKKSGWRNYSKLQMSFDGLFSYSASIPSEILKNGILEYYLAIENKGKVDTYPGGHGTDPNHWGFRGEDPYILKILPPSNSISLFDPEFDMKNISSPNVWYSLRSSGEVQFDSSWERAYTLTLGEYNRELFEYVIQIYVGGYTKDFNKKIEKIEIDASLNSEVINSLEYRFIYSDNLGFKEEITDVNNMQKTNIDTGNKEPVKYALIPRPYPTFLPYWFIAEQDEEVKNIQEPFLEFIQISLPLKIEFLNQDLKTSFRIKSIKAVSKNK